MAVKRSVVSILLCLVVCLVGCSNSKRTDHLLASPLVYEYAQSAMTDDILIKDDKVYIYCDIVITNNNDIPVSFYLYGYFGEDQQGGLLKDRNIYAYSVGGDGITNQKILSIGKKSTSTFSVIFIGDHGDKDVKQNRLPPKMVGYLMVYPAVTDTPGVKS